jgi:hypothetical protein
MPSSIDVYFHGKSVSDKPTFLAYGELFFWQNALTDLSRAYFTHSIKPIKLPIPALARGEVPYEPNELALTIHAQHLHDTTESIYPFVLSIQKSRVPFSILTRYLIFNKVTGYHHIF